MKKATRRKWYARSALVGQLSSAIGELTHSIELAGQAPPETPLTESLGKVIKILTQALEYEKMYQLGRKRIRAALLKEKRALDRLLQEAREVPVTQGEKAIAENERHRRVVTGLNAERRAKGGGH